MDQDIDKKFMPIILLFNCSSSRSTILPIISYPETCFDSRVMVTIWLTHAQCRSLQILFSLLFFSWITGSFSDSNICGRNMCQHSGGLGISMDYAEKESKEALTQECVGLVKLESVVLDCDHFIILIFQDLGSKAFIVYM